MLRRGICLIESVRFTMLAHDIAGCLRTLPNAEGTAL